MSNDNDETPVGQHEWEKGFFGTRGLCSRCGARASQAMGGPCSWRPAAAADPERREVPKELEPYMSSDPNVATLVYAYLGGYGDLPSMWRRLALLQTQAAAEARKMAYDALLDHAPPIVIHVDREGAAHLAEALKGRELKHPGDGAKAP